MQISVTDTIVSSDTSKGRVVVEGRIDVEGDEADEEGLI